MGVTADERDWRKRVLLGCGGLQILLVVAVIAGCAFVPRPPKVARLFAGRSPPEIRRYPLPGGRTIAAAETGRKDGPLVVLVHGSPGHWQDFASLLADRELGERARLIAVDRLGWGMSGAGELEPSLAAQARAVGAVLAAHPANRPAIVVGHSLGGAVAARLAIDAPELVNALILVSASIDPALEKPNPLQKLARLTVIHWTVPGIFLRADDEIEPLKHELEAMLPLWAKLRMPVTVIHGTDDWLVPPANADFAARMIVHAPLETIRLPGQGHMIQWQRPDAIRDAVLHRLDRRARKP